MQEMFPQISNAQIKEGIFMALTIKKTYKMAGMLKS
jgi:hypothetical protein